jgi:acyl-CoA reductase-like NAD-dependent aldehyde dehydrogenase
LVEPLAETVKKIKVGPTDRENGGMMGAVISPQHLAKVTSLIDRVKKKARRSWSMAAA